MPFIITLFAGLSTVVGYFFIYLKNDNILVSSLSFSSGVMFFISIFDLLPESFNLISNIYYDVYSLIICLLFFLLGICLSILIDKLSIISKYSNSLYHVGIISMIGIIVHNIPEGIATYLTSSYNLKLGITLGIAIALHNIPEGISISVPIYYSTNSKRKAFVYTFISGTSEFIGAIISFLLFKDFNSDLFMGCLYSFIAGIMIYISLFELLTESFKYKKIGDTVFYFFLGIFLIYISIIFLH